ncbi:hypothetical protein B0H17DRAFT_1134300 [Mycena rosella]|uniref:Uncharacterized protein n=1 Tax=Mycena rosella TaxID=1033263 RepID=A0AAD7DG37_MYCRO|nr:hypothetical protein B0H17DRAFT_1134300 [Mycena rosella]
MRRIENRAPAPPGPTVIACKEDASPAPPVSVPHTGGRIRLPAQLRLRRKRRPNTKATHACKRLRTRITRAERTASEGNGARGGRTLSGEHATRSEEDAPRRRWRADAQRKTHQIRMRRGVGWTNPNGSEDGDGLREWGGRVDSQARVWGIESWGSERSRGRRQAACTLHYEMRGVRTVLSRTAGLKSAAVREVERSSPTGGLTVANEHVSQGPCFCSPEPWPYSVFRTHARGPCKRVDVRATMRRGGGWGRMDGAAVVFMQKSGARYGEGVIGNACRAAPGLQYRYRWKGVRSHSGLRVNASGRDEPITHPSVHGKHFSDNAVMQMFGMSFGYCSTIVGPRYIVADDKRNTRYIVPSTLIMPSYAFLVQFKGPTESSESLRRSTAISPIFTWRYTRIARSSTELKRSSGNWSRSGRITQSSWLRDHFCLPWSSFGLGPAGVVKLDLGSFVHGTEWHKCIDDREKIHTLGPTEY